VAVAVVQLHGKLEDLLQVLAGLVAEEAQLCLTVPQV
jgi:hypothetical protein